MDTRISKIDGEMSEIIEPPQAQPKVKQFANEKSLIILIVEPKIGNPQNSVGQETKNEPFLSHS